MSDAFEDAKKNGGVFDYSKPLSGVEVVDHYAFRIHLKQPYPQLLYWMAMQFFSPSAREAVEYYDGAEHPDGPGGKMVIRPLYRWHPVTTGPFRLASYRQGQAFRFVRNENYHTTTFPTEGWEPEMESLLRPLASAQLPLVDEIQMPILREELPIWLLTRQGYLDFSGIGKDAFNAAVSSTRELSPKYAARGMRLGKKVEPSTFWLMFNMQDPVLGPNKKLRQALSCAYDAQGWIDIFYNGTADLATQLIPPGFYGHQKGLKNPYGFDLEKGKRLIAEAGYPNGIDPKTGQPLELAIDATASDSWHRQTVEFEQRCLEQLGVRVRVNENTFTRLQEKLDQGNFQISSSGWGADYPDPENYFFLFYSKNFPLSGQNWSRYANPEFDRMFEQMASMENSPERLELVHKMTAFLIEDCPIVLNFHKAYLVIIQPWAPRTNHNDMLEMGLKYVVADPVLRDQKRREWNRKPMWPIGIALLGVVALAGYGVRWNRRRIL
jgi:ABC-type transport system substrate-binding protein